LKTIKHSFIFILLISVLGLCFHSTLLSFVNDNGGFKKQMVGNQQPVGEEEKERDETETRESNEFAAISCYFKNITHKLNFYYLDFYSELPFFDIIKPPPTI